MDKLISTHNSATGNPGCGWFSKLATPFAKFEHNLKEPNWEQRRYEIAKDYYVNNPSATAEGAVRQADKLIEALKSTTNNLED